MVLIYFSTFSFFKGSNYIHQMKTGPESSLHLAIQLPLPTCLNACLTNTAHTYITQIEAISLLGFFLRGIVLYKSGTWGTRADGLISR
jgi:hypothetical protein